MFAHTQTHTKVFPGKMVVPSATTAEEAATFRAPSPCFRQPSHSPAETSEMAHNGSMLPSQCFINMYHDISDSKCNVIAIAGSENGNDFRKIIFPRLYNLLGHLEKK